MLHEHLYADAPPKERRIKEVHPYLGDYLTILRNSKLTINYNFDDHVERMLLEERSEAEKSSTRGYQSVCSLTLPFRRRAMREMLICHVSLDAPAAVPAPDAAPKTVKSLSVT